MAPSHRTSDEDLARQIEQAMETGKHEPVAVAARFDSATSRIIVDLASGITFMFPVSLAQGLADASPDDVAEVEVTPGGLGLHWESLDIDFSISGLLAGVFGSRSWMARVYADMGRKGGTSRSRAKVQAARRNGRMGGRPKKQACS